LPCRLAISAWCTARVGAAALQRRDDVEAVAVAEAHVDHGEGGRLALDLLEALADRFGGRHRVAARLHRPRQPLQEGAVVVDDQQCLLRRRLGACRDHHCGSRCLLQLCACSN
jgi:hypothetical protein